MTWELSITYIGVEIFRGSTPGNQDNIPVSPNKSMHWELSFRYVADDFIWGGLRSAQGQFSHSLHEINDLALMRYIGRGMTSFTENCPVLYMKSIP